MVAGSLLLLALRQIPVLAIEPFSSRKSAVKPGGDCADALPTRESADSIRAGTVQWRDSKSLAGEAKIRPTLEFNA